MRAIHVSACCASSRRFEPWFSWELRLLFIKVHYYYYYYYYSISVGGKHGLTSQSRGQEVERKKSSCQTYQFECYLSNLDYFRHRHGGLVVKASAS